MADINNRPHWLASGKSRDECLFQTAVTDAHLRRYKPSLTHCMYVQHHARMPSKASLAIAALGVAVIITNAMWAVHAVNQQTALTYSHQATLDAIALLDQAIAALPVAAKADASEAEVVRAAQRPGAANAPYEKSGYLWVDGLGLRFSPQGRLTGAAALVENPEQHGLWVVPPSGALLALGQMANADN